jgi:hypothetical protein
MDGRDKLEKLRHALARSREENKKKGKEKEEEEEKNFETSNRRVDCNPEKRTSCGIFREKEEDLEEEAGGTEVSVGNIGNGRTTDVSPEKTETKENKEHVYERRDVDDSGQIRGRANGRRVRRRDSRRIEGGVTGVRNPQKRARRVESDSRSQIRQSISGDTKVQTRRSRIIRSYSPKRRLYDKRRHKTRLSSHKNDRRGIIVSRVQAQGENVQIFGDADGEQFEPVHIPYDGEASTEIYQRSAEDQDSVVCGRFPDLLEKQGGGGEGRRSSVDGAHTTRLENQLGKIRLRSRTTEDVSGVHHRHNRRADIESSVSEEEVDKERGKETARISSKRRKSQSKTHCKSGRALSSNLEGSDTYSNLHQRTVEMYSQRNVGTTMEQRGSSHFSWSSQGSSAVAGNLALLEWAVNHYGSIRCSDRHGQFELWLGSTNRSDMCRSELVERDKETAHKCEGINSSALRDQEFEREVERQENMHSSGQQGGHVLLEQDDRENEAFGGDCESDSFGGHGNGIVIARDLYRKQRERRCRRNIKNKRVPQLGSLGIRLSKVRKKVGTTHNRQVRRSQKQQIRSIQQSIYESKFRRNRRTRTRLEQREQLRGSTNSIDTCDINEDQGNGDERNTNDGDNSGTEMAGPAMVSIAEGNGSGNDGVRGSDQEQCDVEVRTTFYSIKDLWTIRKRLWPQEAIISLQESARTGGVETTWKKIWSFCMDRGISLLHDDSEVTQAMLIEYIASKVRGLQRPQAFVDLVKRAIAHAFMASNKPNPLRDDELIKKYLKKEVKDNTKRPRNRKGVLHIATTLIRCYQVYGDPKTYTETRLRVVVAMIIAMAKIFRIGDLYSINAAEVKFHSQLEYVILPLRGYKVDPLSEGSLACVWATSNNPFNPVELLWNYMELTKDRREYFENNRDGVLEHMKNRSNKHHIYAQKLERSGMVPLFWCQKMWEPYCQGSMESDIRKLLDELQIKRDFMNRKISPGCIRKSARMTAKKAGFLEAELDAIGHWTHKSVPREYYEDFVVPRDTSDVILQSDLVAEAVEKITAGELDVGIPTYQASTMENRMNELEEEESNEEDDTDQEELDSA